MKSRVLLLFSLLSVILLSLAPRVSAQAFVHPGLLHTEADFDRMRTKVNLGAQPWLSGWNALTGNGYSQLGAYPRAVEEVTRPGNVAQMYIDIYRAYQSALRWKVSGDTRYADQAVLFLNAWSSTMKYLNGNADRFLAAGIHGYQWANVGEIMRTYPGWAAADVERFQNLLLTVFYPKNHDFLVNHNGAAITNYWSNWDLCNMASMLAIGVFCDRRDIYDEAIAYIYQGGGNGAIDRAIYHLHPGNLGQMQESGRDQGHTTLSISLLGPICEMAWNQGVDLYGYRNNRFLAGAEYVARYNSWNDVPFTPYMWGTGQSGAWQAQWGVSGAARGHNRPCWEMVYNHYVNRLGLAAPYAKAEAEELRPEGNGGNGDQLGFGTLTFTREPIAAGATPKLNAIQRAGDVVLSWWGSAYATSYHVKRATAPGGPYVTIATNVPVTNPTYTDVNAAAAGIPYHYVITGVLPSAQETGPSNEVKASFPAALRTHLKFDETSGTTAADFTGNGNSGTLVNGASWSPGKSGNAVTLDGVNDHVSLPVGSLAGLSDFTLASWVLLNDSRTWSRICDFGGKPGSYLFLTPRASNGKTRFAISTVYNYNQQVVEGPALPTGQWVHVAVTLSDEVATLYINGIEAGRNTGFFLQPLQLGETQQSFIGRSQFGNDPYLNGKVDDFRIYDYALSGSAIYGLWGQSANRGPEFTGEQVFKASAPEDADYGTIAQTLATSASDPDGNAMAFAKLDGPAWLAVAANGALTGTPANGDVGENVFLVRVTDPSGAGSIARLKIQVSNTNDAPVWSADPIVKRSVTRDQPYLATTLAGEASDVDGGATLTFSKVAGPPWLSVAADGTLTGTPAAADTGSNNFTVRVTDNAGTQADATLSITVLPFEMRAHLRFEDNPNDSLGHFDATATGTPAYATGRLARGLWLDGTDDHLTLPAAASDSHDITVAAWVFWHGGGQHQRVFDFGNSTSQYLYLSPNSAGSLRFAIRNGGDEQQVNAAVLPTGQWVHLAVTLGGSTATVYVNGTAVASHNAITLHPGDFKPAWNFIGKSQWPDPLFNGKIDEFRLYNHALTPAQIAVLMDEVPAVPHGVIATPRTGSIDLSWTASQGAQTYSVKRSQSPGGPYTVVASGLTGTVFSDTGLTNGTPYFYVISATNALGESAGSDPVTAVPSDLLAWWKFNETTGTLAIDSSGNGKNGTLTNGPAWAAGLFNGGVHIPAVNNESVTLPAGIVSGLGDFTISGWVKVNAFTTFARIFDFGTGTNNYMFLTPQYTAIAPNAAKLRFAIRTPAVTEDPAGAALNRIDSTVALTAGTWTHVAVTLAGTTGRLYVDGSLAGTTTTMTLKPSDLGNTTLNWFGDSQFGADPTFNGQLDEFRIHSRALSDAEIDAAAHPSPGVPDGLAAGAGDTQIPLSWNLADFASTYTLKRATASGGPYTEIASGLTSPAFTDTDLTNGTTYYYVVRSSNDHGESADSPEVAATPSHLRVHLKLDESEGTTASDASGLGWHGTTVNGPAWEPGKAGNALAFTGSSSHHLTLPTGVLGGLTETTIMAWVKLNGEPTTWQRVFDFGTGTDNYLFLTSQYGTGGNANKLRFAIRTPAVGEEIIDSSVATPLGEWAHVAVVLSGNTGRLFLNGVQVGENTAMTLTPASLGITTQNYLGKSQWNDPYLNAALDEFRIESRALTAEEVAAFATPLAAPQNLAATGGLQQIDLAWDAVPEAATYTVKSATTAGGPYTTVASGLSVPGFTHAGLPPLTTRYYVVSATHVAGTSTDSAEASATTESAPITEGEIRNAALSLSALTTSGGNLAMNIAASVIGHTYQVQHSPDLSEGSWENVGVPMDGNGSPLQALLPVTPGERGFYRILITR
jgi:hypothetical protein